MARRLLPSKARRPCPAASWPSKSDPMRLSPLSIALLACLTLGAVGCDIPRDPEGTLDRVRNGTLRVGLSDAPPWTSARDTAAGGVEPELLRAFARSLGAEIEWRWGSVDDHMEALARYELDVVAAGLTRDTPWKTHVALTNSYHTDTIRLVAPGREGVGREIVRHRVLAVPPGENGFLMALEDLLLRADVEDLLTTREGGR